MRVAFTMIGGRHWIGGYNYLLNTFRVLRKYGTGQVQPVLFVGDDFPQTDLAPFATIGYDIVRSPAFDRRRQHRSLASAMITGKDREAERIFQAHDIDVVFEVASFLGWRLGFPAVAWIPDFQHRHLSHMFSKNAYWRRELGLRAQVKTGRMIMLSSEDARKSCEQFYPSSCGRTHVVRFAVQLDEAILAMDPEEVRARHGLPENYIYLPNQFWRHKNHRIVIEALALLPDSHVVIASTGHGVDPRHPTLYEELRSLVNGGSCLITVPYGRAASHGWYQVFDASMIASILEVFQPVKTEITYFGYSAQGWAKTDPATLKDATFFDMHARKDYDADYAAGARAVACLHLVA